ncbi:MAG: chromate transporter [Eubacteriales bacterium]|nr:chromate transporter [Eubacteriales bacterium]
MKSVFELFISFFKIGLFTFGGGYAMLPMLKKELVEAKGWVTEEEILDYFAIGQLTPGVIAVNTATFVGYKKKGISGGIMATLGVVCPSLIIITIIAAMLSNFAHIWWVKSAFSGIRIVVLALIIKSLWGLMSKGIKDIFTGVIFAVTVAGMLFEVPSVLIIILAAVSGIVYKAVAKR